jgi:hypothetical protein
MDDGNLTNDLPIWWPYPASCGQEHPWGQGKIIVTFRPCACVGGELGAGESDFTRAHAPPEPLARQGAALAPFVLL